MKIMMTYISIFCAVVIIHFIYILSTAKSTTEYNSDQTKETQMTKVDWNMFFEAIRLVETGGQADPTESVGDNGKSIGPYQIGKLYWIDSQVDGKWEDCKQYEYSRLVMMRYWQRYCLAETNKKDWETMARIHNGGPRGHKKQATIKYWQKVKKHL